MGIFSRRGDCPACGVRSMNQTMVDDTLFKCDCGHHERRYEAGMTGPMWGITDNSQAPFDRRALNRANASLERSIRADRNKPREKSWWAKRPGEK
jgi:hypothetical protein